jgi:hypothetical protein
LKWGNKMVDDAKSTERDPPAYAPVQSPHAPSSHFSEHPSESASLAPTWERTRELEEARQEDERGENSFWRGASLGDKGLVELRSDSLLTASYAVESLTPAYLADLYKRAIVRSIAVGIVWLFVGPIVGSPILIVVAISYVVCEGLSMFEGHWRARLNLKQSWRDRASYTDDGERERRKARLVRANYPWRGLDRDPMTMPIGLKSELYERGLYKP